MPKPSAMIVTCIGPQSLVSIAKSLGIQSEQKPVISTADGAGMVTLLELTNSYTTFASGGMYQEPILGREHLNTPSKRILSEKVTNVITSMLQGTIAARSSVSSDNQHNFAVKQGATPHGRDGWCIDYQTGSTQHVAGPVIGVWVGIDDGILICKKGGILKHTERKIWSDLANIGMNR